MALIFSLAAALAFVSCGNSSGKIVPGNSLFDKLVWMKDNAKSGESYIFELRADESTDRLTLSFSDRTGTTITVRGVGVNRTISLSEKTIMFAVMEGNTLVLDKNITLKGRDDNIDPLVYVITGGTLVMNDGTFTMNGGTISNNSAATVGGGMYLETGLFTKTGGTITGYESNQKNSNVVKDSSGAIRSDRGHAIFATNSDIGAAGLKEVTAGPRVNLSYNGNDGAFTGDWDDSRSAQSQGGTSSGGQAYSPPAQRTSAQQTTQASQSSGSVSFIMASENDFTVKLADDYTVIITKYNGRGGNIIIPEKIQGVQVTQIGDSAFAGLNGEEGRAKVTGVQLPEGLKVIGTYAFRRSSISTVTIPNTVTQILRSAFAYCENLESISIPDSVTLFGWYLERHIQDEDSIFENSGLKTFTFPAGLIATKGIPKYMFKGSSLEKIVIPEGIETIGWEAFSSCRSLTSVTLPSTIKTIEENAFQRCTSLTEEIIPESVASIYFYGGNRQFADCSRLSLAFQARLKRLGYTGNF